MIRAQGGDRGVCLTWNLPHGANAYVDADWVPTSGSDDVPAIIVSAAGEVGRSGADPVRQADGLNADTAAGLWLLALADQAVAATGTRTARIEVSGRGAVASLVAHRCDSTPLGSHDRRDRPAAVIETTADPSTLRAACRRVADLGVVVLAGEVAGRAVPIDLYPDVHVRGLELVGVPESPVASPPGDPSRLPAWLFDGLVVAYQGEPLADATWYRLG